MDWVTVVWSMVASAGLTLAAIYLLVWLRNRTEPAHLFFSLTAIATAAFTFFELWMMHSTTTEEFGIALRWSHAPLFVLNVSIAWYVFLYLKAGRLWLVWTICGMRALVLLLNFLMLPNIHYRRITELAHISILGASIAVAKGIPNPWMLIGQATTVTLFIFVVDASVTAWKRGDRRKAVMVGGSVGSFVLAAFALTLAVLWGFVESPFFFGILCMGLISVMAYELGHDVLRTTRLLQELQISQAGRRESDERVSLAVEAGDFGIWAWDMTRNEFWASDSLRHQFGFAPSDAVDFDRILQRVHPDDREAVLKTHVAATSGGAGRYRRSAAAGWHDSLG
jgi:PAS domain-containing protein